MSLITHHQQGKGLAMRSDDEKWMTLALEQATLARDLNEVPIGAVLVRDQAMVAAAHNRMIRDNDPSAHAEVLVMRLAAQRLGNYRLAGSRLYVTVEPCAMCAGAMLHARIDELVFGAPEPRAGAVISQLNLFDQHFVNHRVSWRGGVMREASSALMETFFAKRR